MTDYGRVSTQADLTTFLTDSEQAELHNDTTNTLQLQLYTRRWFILAWFCLLTASNAFLWICFAPRTQLFQTYLHVAHHPIYINSLSLVFMLAYPVCLVPCLLVMKSRKHGLRNAIVLGALLDWFGAAVRWLGARSFGWVLAGQSLAAVGQIFILAVPPKLASTWFGAKERNTACAVAIAANSLGIALGFLASLALPERWTGDQDAILVERYMIWQMIACFVILVGCAVCIPSQPPLPPSTSTAQEDNPRRTSPHRSSLWSLSRDRSFWCLTVSTGISMGANFTLQTILDQVLSPVFPNLQNAIPYLGFTFVLLGMGATVLCGWYLDKTLRYKGTLRTLQLFSVLCILLAHGVLKYASQSQESFLVLACLLVLYGVAVAGVMPAGFQYASELYYPTSEMVLSSVLNLSSCCISSILLLVMSALDLPGMDGEPSSHQYTMEGAMLVFCGFIFTGALASFGVTGKLQRQSRDFAASEGESAREVLEDAVEIEYK